MGWLHAHAHKLRERAHFMLEEPRWFLVCFGTGGVPQQPGYVLGVPAVCEPGERVSVVLMTDKGNMGYSMPRGGDA